VAPKREVAIEAVHLTKVFRDFWRRPRVRAVDDFNLEVYRGEVFGLLGPNGSGKSTVLKLMLGLLFPTSGTVAILGHHPRNQRVKARIGFLPEETYLYRYLNADETLDFYGRLFNIDAHKRRTRNERLLEMVGLMPHRRRPLGEYSKGMARRIGLAQALINDPDLLLLDEPTSGLDPIGTREIKDLILELKARGKTVFICSHLLADMEDVCDRIGIMYGGKLRVVGPVSELLKKRSVTRIETEELPPATLERIFAVLREEVPDRKVMVEVPQVRLEEYFLQVITAARAEEPVTTGATAGKAAGFFWEGEELAKGAAVIEQLLKGEEAQPVPQVAPESPPVEKRERAEVIAGLVSETPPPAPVVLPEEPPPDRQEQEERRKRAAALLRQFVQPGNDSKAGTEGTADKGEKREQSA